MVKAISSPSGGFFFFFFQKDSMQPKEHLTWGNFTGTQMAVRKQHGERTLEARLSCGGLSPICMRLDPSVDADLVGVAPV